MLKSESINLPFRKALKIRIWLSVLIIIVGLKSAFISLLDQAWDIQSITAQFGIELTNFELLKGIYSAFGCVLIVVGAFSVLRNTSLIRNNENFKKAEISYGDERNRLIRNTTANVSTYILLVFLSLAVIISGMFNLIVSLTLLCLLLAYLKILFITYLIVRTKY